MRGTRVRGPKRPIEPTQAVQEPRDAPAGPEPTERRSAQHQEPGERAPSGKSLAEHLHGLWAVLGLED